MYERRREWYSRTRITRHRKRGGRGRGFGPENMGVPTEEIWARVDKSLEAVGMTAYRLQSPNKLSGGQKQRVAIAGVMAMKPGVSFWTSRQRC
mgnify:CR=1 FL=1